MCLSSSSITANMMSSGVPTDSPLAESPRATTDCFCKPFDES
jgi:hypothetical protein